MVYKQLFMFIGNNRAIALDEQSHRYGYTVSLKIEKGR